MRDALSASLVRQQELEQQVYALNSEVNALEAKLGELHATDVSSLRRAYKTLAQHVQALDVETKHLPALLDRATEAAVTSDFVAKQTSVVATAATVVYAVGRLLRTLQVKDAGPISAGIALLGAGFVGLRLVAATLSRLGQTAARRQRAEQQLRADLREVMERIKVMTELAESGLKLHRLHFSQQQMLAPAQAPGQGQGQGQGVWQPQVQAPGQRQGVWQGPGQAQGQGQGVWQPQMQGPGQPWPQPQGQGLGPPQWPFPVQQERRAAGGHQAGGPEEAGWGAEGQAAATDAGWG